MKVEIEVSDYDLEQIIGSKIYDKLTDEQKKTIATDLTTMTMRYFNEEYFIFDDDVVPLLEDMKIKIEDEEKN